MDSALIRNGCCDLVFCSISLHDSCECHPENDDELCGNAST